MDQKGGGGDHGDVPKIPIRPPLTVAKAVVLFGEGLQRPLKGDSGGEANTMLEALGAADLDWIAQVGCGGTLRPRSGHEADEVAELAQVLGAYEYFYKEGEPVPRPDCSQYFKQYGGLKVGLLSDSNKARKLAAQIHLPVYQSIHEMLQVPAKLKAEEVGKELKDLLGFGSTSHADLMFVHINASGSDVLANYTIHFFNDLVHYLRESLGEKLYLAVIASTPASAIPAGKTSTSNNVDPQFYVPIQSGSVYHRQRVSLREEEPMSVVYYHAGSTRRDEVQRFTERECREKGANLFISAEQFLSELAFKLGKTPKYGA